MYKKGQHPLDKLLPANAFHLTAEKFLSYNQLANNDYMEAVGIYYDDLIIGETYEHRPAKTFTFEESRVHALRSLDWNPQYADLHYAEKFLAGKTPINETFLIGSITALTTRTFGRVVANLQWKNINLPELVYAGDTIFAESTIMAKRESKSRPAQGIMQVTTQAFNQHGKLVCAYERHFLIYKKGLGPYQTAGY
jgi:itaconyl-CoA hydratase